MKIHVLPQRLVPFNIFEYLWRQAASKILGKLVGICELWVQCFLKTCWYWVNRRIFDISWSAPTHPNHVRSRIASKCTFCMWWNGKREYNWDNRPRRFSRDYRSSVSFLALPAYTRGNYTELLRSRCSLGRRPASKAWTIPWWKWRTSVIIRSWGKQSMHN